MRALLACLALVLAAPGMASEPEAWRPVDAETGKIRDIEGLEELARAFPDSGNVRLRMLQPYLEAGEPEKVLHTLEWLYDRGYVFSEVAQTQIPKLLEGVDPGRIAERLIAKAEVIAASEVVATVPAEAGLVEAVLMDIDGGRIAATSVNNGALWGMAPDGNWAEFSVPDVRNISGIAAEYGVGRVWVAAGRIDESEDDGVPAFAGLISPSFGPGEDTRVAAPEGAVLSDLHGASDGTIYASDPKGGGVYMRKPGESAMHTLVTPGTLRSPQGLVSNADNTRLYVSDYRYGIAIVDLATREVRRLESDVPAILDGVDGLYRHGNSLIAVQNGTSPMRISALELSKDGLRVVGYRVLEQANPEWTEPLAGHVGHGALYYIGNGQWDRYVGGELAEGMEALPTQIRRLPLSAE